ncbi:hypothetical protein LINGRAHAP2_LOCUS31690 [Linum grandiflorum]
MSGDKTWFTDLDTSFKCRVRMGNDLNLDVVGKGTVKLLVNQVSLVVHEVFYVLGLKTNLLSVGQLTEKGLAFVIKNGFCQLLHANKVF